MRILIFHGYLLAGTGSNVYNARLAEALVGLGHELHLLSQDRHPEQYPFVDAVGDWDDGRLLVRRLREPTRCTVYRPAIGDLLPVYVLDRYEDIEARTFADCSDDEIRRYLDANVAAVSEVCKRVRPEVALANHLIMGPAILARALTDFELPHSDCLHTHLPHNDRPRTNLPHDTSRTTLPDDTSRTNLPHDTSHTTLPDDTSHTEIPYAVKVHGSALEYTVKPEPERFLPFAREGLERTKAILVGSRHTARSLWEALDDPTVRERTRLGPPGVDVSGFEPRSPAQAASAIHALTGRLASAPQGGAERKSANNAFARDDRAAARALERIDPHSDRLVGFVGKLILNKGIDLLIAAWPYVLEQNPDARLLIVGFGSDRQWLEQLLWSLAAGDLERARNGAARHLTAHLRGLLGAARAETRERYLRAARALPERAVFTGRLDHAELIDLLPACEALVVPSTFPEAFGMVAAEAAACGALPISAAHSGLAEVSDTLAGNVPAQAAQWLSFPVDDRAVEAIAERLNGWLSADPELRRQTREGLVATVRAHWSWESVAQHVIAAAAGELDTLADPDR